MSGARTLHCACHRALYHSPLPPLLPPPSPHAATARASVRATKPASAARVKGERSKRITRAMMPRAPRTVTSVARARHRERHQSALPPPPPPPPPRLACTALRAPGGIARGRCRAARAAASSPISGNPEGVSNPQRRRHIGDGHQAQAKNDPMLGRGDTHAKKRSDRINGPGRRAACEACGRVVWGRSDANTHHATAHRSTRSIEPNDRLYLWQRALAQKHQ